MVSCDSNSLHGPWNDKAVSWGVSVWGLLVQSHGIPEEVIDNAVKAAKKYFSLPEAAKMEVS